MNKITMSLWLCIAAISVHAQNYFTPDPSASAGSIYQDGSGLIGIGTAVPTASLTVFAVPSFSPPSSIVEVDNSKTVNTSSGGGVSTVTTSYGAAYSLLVKRNVTLTTGSVLTGGSSTSGGAIVDMVVSGTGLTGLGVATPAAHLDITDQNNDGLPLLQATPNGSSTPMFQIDPTGVVSIGGAVYPGAYFAAQVQGDLGVLGDAGIYGDGMITEHLYLGGNDTYTGSLRVQSQAVTGQDYSAQIQVSDPTMKALDIQMESVGSVFKIYGDGHTVIGNPSTVPNIYNASTTPNGYSLYVAHGILTEQVKVATSGTTDWSDYVFEKNYKLPKLDDVQSYITAHHHLPDVPSTDDVNCEGIDLAQMDATLLRKIEELTLYVLKQQKEIEALKSQK